MPSKRIDEDGRIEEPIDSGRQGLKMKNMGPWKPEERKRWDKFGKMTKVKVQSCETFCDTSECTEMEFDNEGNI